MKKTCVQLLLQEPGTLPWEEKYSWEHVFNCVYMRPCMVYRCLWECFRLLVLHRTFGGCTGSGWGGVSFLHSNPLHLWQTAVLTHNVLAIAEQSRLYFSHSATPASRFGAHKTLGEGTQLIPTDRRDIPYHMTPCWAMNLAGRVFLGR